MKTRILTLTAALLLLGGGFVACNDSEESEAIGTPPVSAPTDVSAFFKTYLPSSSYSQPEPEFNFSEIDFRDTECFVINSMEEFEAAVDTESEKMTLNLVYKELKGGTPASMTIFYFWGLYTKLPEKTLTADITII